MNKPDFSNFLEKFEEKFEGKFEGMFDRFSTYRWVRLTDDLIELYYNPFKTSNPLQYNRSELLTAIFNYIYYQSSFATIEVWLEHIERMLNGLCYFNEVYSPNEKISSLLDILSQLKCNHISEYENTRKFSEMCSSYVYGFSSDLSSSPMNIKPFLDLLKNSFPTLFVLPPINLKF